MVKKKILASADEKARLKRLNRLGLAHVDLRKPMTRYRRRLLKKFLPVLDKGFSPVSFDAAPRALRNMLASEYARDYPDTTILIKNKLFVKSAHLKQKTFWNPKTKALQSTFRIGDKFTKLDWRRPGDKSVDTEQEYDNQKLSFFLPFWRGKNKPMFYKSFSSYADAYAEAMKYENDENNPYINAHKYIFRATFGGRQTPIGPEQTKINARNKKQFLELKNREAQKVFVPRGAENDNYFDDEGEDDF